MNSSVVPVTDSTVQASAGHFSLYTTFVDSSVTSIEPVKTALTGFDSASPLESDAFTFT